MKQVKDGQAKRDRRKRQAKMRHAEEKSMRKRMTGEEEHFYFRDGGGSITTVELGQARMSFNRT